LGPRRRLQVEVGCDAAVFASAPPERRGARPGRDCTVAAPRPRSFLRAEDGRRPSPGSARSLGAGTRQNTVFVDCPPRPRALTVNAGDQIEVWTNGRFRSCVHRVANPPPGSDSARLSLVLFTGPRPETSLAPLPSCVSADRPAKFAATTSGAHLLAKIAASEA